MSNGRINTSNTPKTTANKNKRKKGNLLSTKCVYINVKMPVSFKVKNLRKKLTYFFFKGVDFMSTATVDTPEQRSCLTSLSCK